MKSIIKICLLAITMAGGISCKKQSVVTVDGGALNVTNAVIGGANITLVTATDSMRLISTNNTVGPNSSGFLPVATAAKDVVTLEVPAVPATATTAAIPAVVYYSQTLAIGSQDNYSLFLTGVSPAAVDNVLIHESYARTYSDSSCGVRFINLSPGSNPVSVNLKGSGVGSEAAGLGYKAYSGFVKYPATVAAANYTFEFRDAGTGNLITSYKLTTPYFHNVTLCLRGVVGGAVGVIVDNDY